MDCIMLNFVINACMLLYLSVKLIKNYLNRFSGLYEAMQRFGSGNGQAETL